MHPRRTASGPGAPRGTGSPRRALLASIVLLGAVGSCELPKPQIPSIGAAPADGTAAAAPSPAAAAGTLRPRAS